MSLVDPELLWSAVRDVASVLAFRSLPIAACALQSRSVPLRARALLGGSVPAAAVLLDRAGVLLLGDVALAYAYLVPVSCCVPAVARALRADRISRGATLAGSIAVFFVLPAVLWPASVKGAALVLGWDLMLSSYSYCVEVARSRSRPALRDCLFFLLVNPVLVYTERGSSVSPPGWNRAGLLRAAQGLLALLAPAALLVPAYAALRAYAPAAGAGPQALALPALCGMLRFLVEYARQSGLASLQIGLLRQLGYAIPERFVHPLSARSPEDFWRRWNTYVSHWLLRYVFWPLSTGLGRRARSPALRSGAPAVGLLATFGVAGLLHDLYVYGAGLVIETRMLQAFAVYGAVVLASVAAVRLWRAVQEWRAAPASPGRAVDLAQRALLWTTATASFAWWWQ